MRRVPKYTVSGSIKESGLTSELCVGLASKDFRFFVVELRDDLLYKELNCNPFLIRLIYFRIWKIILANEYVTEDMEGKHLICLRNEFEAWEGSSYWHNDRTFFDLEK